MNWFFAPLPRYRVYSDWKSYRSIFFDMLFGGYDKGDGVQQLEQGLVERCRVKHAIAMPMARVGIHLALKALIKPGSKVIMSPYTIADVVNMVHNAGGIPTFADIERHSMNIDPNAVEDLLDEQTGAVLVTHLHGISAEIEAIQEMCQRRGVPVLEDAAQSFGAVKSGKALGTISDAGIYSFGMYKNVNAWFGGAVVTDRDDVAQKIRQEMQSYPVQDKSKLFKRMKKGFITDFATNPLIFRMLTYHLFRYGCLNDVEWINKKVRIELDTGLHNEIPPHYLCRLSSSQAKLIHSQFPKVDENSRQRVLRAQEYYEGLVDLPGIVLPSKPSGLEHIYTYFPIQCENRNELEKWMMKNRRDIQLQHLKNCADLAGFSAWYRDCPNARLAASQVVLLPTYPRYAMSQVQKNIQALKKYFSLKPEPVAVT